MTSDIDKTLILCAYSEQINTYYATIQEKKAFEAYNLARNNGGDTSESWNNYKAARINKNIAIFKSYQALLDCIN